MNQETFLHDYIDRLPDSMKDLVRKEKAIFEQMFRKDIIGEVNDDCAILITDRDKWMLTALAILSARITFVGDWCAIINNELSSLIEND